MCVCAPLHPTLCNSMARLLCPWDFPGKNTGGGLPFLSPGDLPNPEIKPASLASPAVACGIFTTVPPGKPPVYT